MNVRNRGNEESVAVEETMRHATLLTQKADHVLKSAFQFAVEHASRKICYAHQFFFEDAFIFFVDRSCHMFL